MAANRTVVRELVGRVVRQRDAFRTVAEELLDVYTTLFYSPFSQYGEGPPGRSPSD